jgi:lipoyl-dependent peroxiredoxin
MKRHATAVWLGSGKEGKGHLSTQSTILNKTQYSFSSRFEDGIGTNPEELVAAAHAGCFAMKLSFVLGEAEYTPDELQVRCDVTFENGQITKSHLNLKAKVQGIKAEDFVKAVENAKENCPISKSLTAEISIEYSLN